MWWNKYESAQFKVKGRGPDEFDCWGLVKEIYKNDHPEKIILPSYIECYETTTLKDDKIKISDTILQEQQIKWCKVDKPQPFDVVVLKIAGFPMHVGIVIRKGVMIHCTQGINVAIEKYTSMRWDNKVMGFYRYEQ